jgi:hypothetical protein
LSAAAISILLAAPEDTNLLIDNYDIPHATPVSMLTMMGWKQATTVIEEDNAACVASSQVTHITRGMRHFELADHYFTGKVADGTCIIIKIRSDDNN